MIQSIPPTLWVLLSAMAAGYFTRRIGWLHAPSARRIMVAVQKFVTPWILFFSFWGLKLHIGSVLALPLIGLGVIFLQFGLAVSALRFLKLPEPARGAFLVAAILSNVGYLGWSINQALFGKPGFDHAFLYGFYFTFAVYAFAYPVAARCSEHPHMKTLTLVQRLTVEGIVFMAALGIAVGFVLNVMNIERPAVVARFNPILVVASTAVLMFAAGLTLRLRELQRHIRTCLVISLIKLVLSPCIIAGAIFLVSLYVAVDPIMARVLVIESMMPLAISCLSISAIFRLDQDLMNGMWLISTVLFFLLFHVALTMGIAL